MKIENKFSPFKGGIALAALAALLVVPSISRAGRPANRVVAAIPVGSGPLGVVVSPDSSTVYVANDGSNTVSVIDAATNTVKFVIPTDILPNGLAISPDGSTLYVSCEATAETVDVISTATNTVTSTISLVSNVSTTAFITLSPDGSQLYYPIDNSMYIIDTATKTVSGIINNLGPPGYFALQVVFTPNGADAYVVANQGYHTLLSLIDTTSQSLVSTQRIGGLNSAGIAINPILNQLYVSSGKRLNGALVCKITEVDAATDKVLSSSILPAHAAYNGLALTADGKYLYVLGFSFNKPSKVHTINTANGKEVGQPFTVGVGAFQMAVAPNGKYGYISTILGFNTNGVVTVVDVQEK